MGYHEIDLPNIGLTPDTPMWHLAVGNEFLISHRRIEVIAIGGHWVGFAYSMPNGLEAPEIVSRRKFVELIDSPIPIQKR